MNEDWIKTLEYRPETPVEAQAPNPENPTSTLELRRLTLRTAKILQKRPDPPREVISRNGRLSWKPPKAVRGEPKVTHYNIYANHELNRVRQVPSDQLFIEDNLNADQVYVSAWNDTNQLESVKVMVAWSPGSPAGESSPVIGFVIGNGTVGTNVGPMLAAPRAGYVQQCFGVVKSSDAVADLTFVIKRGGGSVFSAPATIAAGTAAGSTFTVTLISTPLAISQHDVFSMDISSGSGLWKFTAQLE